MTKQCSSCGGFCGKRCKRKNTNNRRMKLKNMDVIDLKEMLAAAIKAKDDGEEVINLKTEHAIDLLEIINHLMDNNYELVT